MSESDSDGGPQRPALPVPPEPACKPTHTGPPATAAEYLRLVRQQSAALPNIFVSTTAPPPCKKPRRCDTPRPLPPPPRFAQPDPQWQRHLVFWFAALQRVVAALPPLDPPHPPDPAPLTAVVKQLPALSVLRRMDYLTILRVLRLLDDTVLVEGLHDLQPEYESIMSNFRDLWVFCLLAFVQPPISGEIATVIRSLLRKAVIERSTLEVPDDTYVAALNVLITILGKYFGQEDAP